MLLDKDDLKENVEIFVQKVKHFRTFYAIG